MVERFQQRKKDVLSKLDKSSKGSWDKRVLELCQKINSLENYYTTSSCSGRIMIMQDKEKKGKGLFNFVSHDLVELKDLEVALKNFSQGCLKFKQEPFILHVVCKDLKSAEKALGFGQTAGFKRSCILSLGKNLLLEICGTEKIEFPIIEDGKLLVSRNFLEIVLNKSNENLEKGWKRIEALKKEFK